MFNLQTSPLNMLIDTNCQALLLSPPFPYNMMCFECGCYKSRCSNLSWFENTGVC